MAKSRSWRTERVGAKFFPEDKAAELKAALQAEDGDLLLFAADKADIVAASLGALRNKLGKDLNLINEEELAFLWVTD